MNHRYFVSDSSLIIDLLNKYMFYGSYMLFYNRPYGNLVKAKLDLANYGFDAAYKNYERTENLFSKFGINRIELIPDILLFQEVVMKYYIELKNTDVIKNLHKQWEEDLELIKLKQITEIAENKRDILDKIQFKFKRGVEEKPINIDKNNKVFDFIISQLRNYISKEYRHFYIKLLLDHPDCKKVMQHVYQFWGKPSGSKDTEKIITRKMASQLFQGYFHSKNLLKMSDEIEHITNKAAEFIGWILSGGNLLEYTEDEYNGMQKKPYFTYKEYLIQSVKGYLSAGKKN